mmetsp:Transcript_13681/g.34505  ORF Transcript_13681/g.34505 Transcript_13681/m.34505 type:complete len:561 (-) Transcript_13681:220-1902(-)|eukprot:jgi/Tetstr1/428121/TSEL_018175.t1
MLAGETLELSHVVPTALTDEMVAAIKEVTKENTSVTLRDAVEQGLPDSLVELPTYDRSKLQTGIVHIGLARGDAMGLEAHNLVYMDSLLRANPEENYKWGYTAIGILPGNAELRDVLQKQNFMYTVISKNSKKLHKPDPDMEENVRVIGSLKEILLAFETPGKMLKVLASETAKIFSISIGELGYQDMTSHADTALIELASKGSSDPSWDEADVDVSSYLGATGVGIIVAGLAARRASMSGGATVMSSDSIVGNGDLLKSKVLERAASSSDALKEWIEFNCKFPNTYLDRMSAATDKTTITDLAVSHGIADRFPIVCEMFSEWLIENKFQDGERGRPKWEDVGVHIVEDSLLEYSAATTRLYTELQFAAAFPALLMGLENLYEAMHNPVLIKFVHSLLTTYTVPILQSKPELASFDFEKCIDKAIERLMNTAVASSLNRVIIDASVRFTEQVLPAIVEAEAKGLNGQMMALSVAAWAHYLVRCVENGSAIRDEKARMIEAALTPADTKESPAETLGFLLDMEPLFHEMLFHKEWRAMVTAEYERIHKVGMREAMNELLQK